jgi:hypothetical protein
LLLPLNPHEIKDIAFDVVVSCSVLHTFLPPWDADALKPFPRMQAYYRLFIYLTGYVALNARSTVYKSISVQNPESPNANAKTLNGGK